MTPGEFSILNAQETANLRSELQKQKDELKAAQGCIQSRDIQLEQQKELITELVEVIELLKMSMRVHPDCTEGSEFEDFVSIAEDVIKKSKES
jgi:hypothetical protein